MTEISLNDKSQAQIAAIAWNDWGVIEVLERYLDRFREAIIDEIWQVVSNEVISEGEAADGQVFADVRKLVAGRGVEAKFFLKTPSGEQNGGSGGDKHVSLGSITISFTSGFDGPVNIRMAVSLPQRAIFGNSLEQSKRIIIEKVKSQFASEVSEIDNVSSISITDTDIVDINSNRNEVANRRIAAVHTSAEVSSEENVKDFAGAVLTGFQALKQIPVWLAEKKE